MRPLVAVDLDGTIVTCRERQMAALRDVTSTMRLVVESPDRVWERKRKGATTAEALIAEGMNGAIAAEAAERWRAQVEHDDLLKIDRVLPGAAPALEMLVCQGWRVAIVTARQRPAAAKRQLTRLGIAELVQETHVVAPSDVVNAKARVLETRKAVGFVGDTEADAAAAALAGVDFVGVGTGQRDPGWLAERVSGPICENLQEATAVIFDKRRERPEPLVVTRKRPG